MGITKSVKKFDSLFVKVLNNNKNKERVLELYFGKLVNSLIVDLKVEFEGEPYNYKISDNIEGYAFGGFTDKGDLQIVKVSVDKSIPTKVEVIIKEGTQIIGVNYDYKSKSINSYKRLPNHTNTLIKQIESKNGKK